jgi:hypothetical protein
MVLRAVVFLLLGAVADGSLNCPAGQYSHYDFTLLKPSKFGALPTVYPR